MFMICNAVEKLTFAKYWQLQMKQYITTFMNATINVVYCVTQAKNIYDRAFASFTLFIV